MKQRLFVVPLLLAYLLIIPAQAANTQAPPVEEPDYFDLTEQEHCIRNYVMSINRRNIDEYGRVLHEDFQQIVDPEREHTIDRVKDVAVMRSQFGLERLVVAIAVQKGEWNPVDEIDGVKCDGCWETTREYTIIASTRKADHATNSRSRFVVAPVTEGEATIYKLRLVQDIGPQETGEGE